MSTPKANDKSISSPDLSLLTQKYEKEKQKRLRPEGNAQYVDLELSSVDRLQHLASDPWVDHNTLNTQAPNLRHGDEIKFLILGAGYGALQSAVRLIQAGFNAGDIRLVDIAGGFGGTWYWNRYPGLMCDVESSIYLPFLEDTGYMPKNRYSYGPELKEYADLVAEKWNLTDKGVFRTTIESYEWDVVRRRWLVRMRQDRGPVEAPISSTVRAQFVVVAKGVLNHPKTPKIQGLEEYQGEMIHTARWHYEISGGSPSDWALSGLKGKRVGFVGTGATAVQCVPELAKWADHLDVFQRTPSGVDERGQKETDPEDWQKTASEKGWQKKRNENWLLNIQGESEHDRIQDGWTTAKAYCSVVGGPHTNPVAPEDIPSHIHAALTTDAPRMERLRQRVEQTVTQDVKTAENLKAWYPSWCKRPCFHDDFLPTFNLPNVTLVDTDGKGVEKATSRGLVVGNTEYKLDIIIWGTGYRAPGNDLSEPSKAFNGKITGRNRSLSEKWRSTGPSTLHGVLTNGFPNMFLTGPTQAGSCPNFAYSLDVLAQHIATIISQAHKGTRDPDLVVIESTKEAEEAWSLEILTRAAWFAPMSVCGPSYHNNEGAMVSREDMGKKMRGAVYPLGMLAFENVLKDWRREGGMKGVVIS